MLTVTASQITSKSTIFQQLIQDVINEKIKAPRQWPFVRAPVDRNSEIVSMMTSSDDVYGNTMWRFNHRLAFQTKSIIWTFTGYDKWYTITDICIYSYQMISYAGPYQSYSFAKELFTYSNHIIKKSKATSFVRMVFNIYTACTISVMTKRLQYHRRSRDRDGELYPT